MCLQDYACNFHIKFKEYGCYAVPLELQWPESLGITKFLFFKSTFFSSFNFHIVVFSFFLWVTKIVSSQEHQ